jgi:hypothetical protein
MKAPDDEAPRSFSAFTRFQMRLVGVDAKEMEGCPQRDIDMVTTLFWVMAGVWLWQSIVFSLTLHMVLASPSEWRPALIAVALLLATIILLYDSYGIMMPSWTAHGLEELKRGGIELEVPLLQRIANASWLTLRLMAAVVTSIMITLFCSLQVFERDIAEESARAARDANKELVAGVEARFNRQLADLDEDRARLAQNRDALIAEDAQLRRRLEADREENDPLVRPLADGLTRLEAEKTEAETTLRQAEARAADELGGTRTAETTGIPGNGPRAQAARQRVEAARRAVEAKAQELNEARAQLTTTRAQRRGEYAQQAGDAQTRLTELQSAKEEAERKLKANTEERARLIGDHGKTIHAELDLDPMRATAVNGFLGKVKALWRLSGDPVIGFVTVLFDIFFFSIEMAAIVSKLATFVPSTYATRLARTEHFRAALEAQMLARDLRDLSDAYEAPAETLDLDVPLAEGEAPVAPEAPQPEARNPAPPPTPPSAPLPNGRDTGKTLDIFTNGGKGSSPKMPEPHPPGNGKMPPSGNDAPRKRGRPRGSKNRPAGDAAA